VTSERELVVQTLAYAALDTLRYAIPLDLCAYLHVVDGDGPQLYLRAPDLSSMTAPQAFDVFTALRDTLGPNDGEDESDGQRVRIGRYDSVAVRSSGARSRSVFVVGREDSPLDDTEIALIDDMCAAMSLATHTVEDTGQAPAPVLSAIGVRIDDGMARAELTFTLPTGLTASGAADAPATTDAVALAVLEALAPGRKLGEVTEGLVSGERVMIALVRDDEGRAAIGTAVVANDPLRAAALATANAVGTNGPT
jgi:hypothetical protein